VGEHDVRAEEQRQIVASKTTIAHCPSANLKLASGVAPIPELVAAGARVALGADGAPCNNNLDGFVEMRLAGLVHRPRLGPAALPAQTILALATRGGARALGLEAELGSLEPGKRADLAVVDVSGIPQAPLGAGDPYSTLVYATSSRDVRDVIVDGRMVVEDRVLRTLDRDEVIARARAAARRAIHQ
jgi:cytosine/adenosine deaminase-related metal-dependent hydrolase